ncbi:hypothetical protein N7532_007495 [Penicillium argentinense]|uniref:MATE efflux family protein n=1 Tax=Penicillium argentinense TaxID=1131581 RepID=A0A9W9K6S8_9EURO|nr:uncharacterized protein N7532_007495 [Penicillium argentinense]KAJ5095204.1 hypothetical protein N7532_007495 [Penicillium argentinense]
MEPNDHLYVHDTERSPLLQKTHAETTTEYVSSKGWKKEALIIVQGSAPLAVALVLQYALTASSIVVLGHLGNREVGAVSLANMTACITGTCVYQGFASSLDTLCPQAYGSGKKTLVGLHLQRMTIMLLLMTIPIGILWLNSDAIFSCILRKEDAETAHLAGLYLKILLAGAPGYACFEAGKRFVQAQGLFSPILLVLLICTVFNISMSWLLVWKLRWGFIGAPISVAISMNLLPMLLALYVYAVQGSECWQPISSAAWNGWGPMLRLAIPSWLIMEAEFATWEIMTLASSYLGSKSLAGQSGVVTITSFAFYIGYSVAVAGGTRVSQLVGAGFLAEARIATRVSFIVAFFTSVVTVALLMCLRNVVSNLFSTDKDVVRLISSILPLCAVELVLDSLVSCLAGVLRAIGRPSLGTYVQIPVYYAMAIPLSFVIAFHLHWGIMGIWTGLLVGQFVLVTVEGALLWYMLDWEKAAMDASIRNMSAWT